MPRESSDSLQTPPLNISNRYRYHQTRCSSRILEWLPNNFSRYFLDYLRVLLPSPLYQRKVILVRVPALRSPVFRLRPRVSRIEIYPRDQRRCRERFEKAGRSYFALVVRARSRSGQLSWIKSVKSLRARQRGKTCARIIASRNERRGGRHNAGPRKTNRRLVSRPREFL